MTIFFYSIQDLNPEFYVYYALSLLNELRSPVFTKLLVIVNNSEILRVPGADLPRESWYPQIFYIYIYIRIRHNMYTRI